MRKVVEIDMWMFVGWKMSKWIKMRKKFTNENSTGYVFASRFKRSRGQLSMYFMPIMH